MKKIFVLLLVSVFLVGCASKAPESASPQAGNSGQASSSTQSSSGAGAGSYAGDAQTPEQEVHVVKFEANTIDGQVFSSEQFGESKVNMINVWATYCNPCLAEMPDLGDVAESYDKADFQLVGIISDVAENAEQADIDNAKDLIVQTEANYPHLLLSQSLYENLVGGVTSVPTTFFVNAKGEMLGYVIGANDEETWKEIIDELLAKEGVIDD